MKLFRISSILSLALAAFLGVLLFWTSQAVQQKQDMLEDSKKELTQEEETLRVLSVEWDYLNRPQRLEKLAREQLGMKAPSADEVVVAVEDIPEPPAPVDENDLYGMNLTQTVSLRPPEKPARKILPRKAEIVSPSTAERQSFDRLIQRLDGGEEQ